MYWDALPDDVRNLIERHECAITIQKYIRHWFVRCARRPGWKPLRNLLTLHMTTHELDTLFCNELVRREWEHEPGSWMYTLISTPENAKMIVCEVADGLWSIS